jgi:aspartate carbamoyltransferase catalytic subunit
MSKRHLVSIDDLSKEEILEIFRIADELAGIYSKRTSTSLLHGKIMATLFYEPSTRTRLSFEAAMLRLDGRVIGSEDMRVSSSAAKGETIADTAKVVSQYADIVVIRHPWDGAAQVAADHSDVPIINAGDGSHEHPTQTLCDLYTLVKEKGPVLKGLTVALCGDLKYGRTIHSFAAALARFGVNLVLIPGQTLEMPRHLLRKLAIKHDQRLERADLGKLKEPFRKFDAVYVTALHGQSQPTLLDLAEQQDLLEETAARYGPGELDAVYMTSPETPSSDVFLEVHYGPARTLGKLDVVYMTRFQKERFSRDVEDASYPRLTSSILSGSPFKKAIVMHPLPRVDEIPKDFDSDHRSKYFAQVRYGVLVRMALLQFLLRESQSNLAFLPAAQASLPGMNDVDNASVSARPPRQGTSYVYRGAPNEIGPQCVNLNCVTRHDQEHIPAKFTILTREKTYTSHELILECVYCGFEVSISFVGNRTTKRFSRYDPALEDFVERWLSENNLILFRNEADARSAKYQEVKKGIETQILNEDDVDGLLERMAKLIAADSENLAETCLIGLKDRGDIIANRIASILKRDHQIDVPVGTLDVIPYRDDVHSTSRPEVEFDFDINDKVVILVDDVFYSGRTTRAAMKALFAEIKKGRPRLVKSAVLVDRGHRQVPIHPQIVGQSIPTEKTQRVSVRLREKNYPHDEVVIFKILME